MSIVDDRAVGALGSQGTFFVVEPNREDLTKIGVVDSARFLKGHSNWFLRTLQPGGYSPERFITGLLPELAAADRRVTGLHVFTFNEIEPTEQWRQETLARLLAA